MFDSYISSLLSAAHHGFSSGVGTASHWERHSKHSLYEHSRPVRSWLHWETGQPQSCGCTTDSGSASSCNSEHLSVYFQRLSLTFNSVCMLHVGSTVRKLTHFSPGKTWSQAVARFVGIVESITPNQLSSKTFLLAPPGLLFRNTFLSLFPLESIKWFYHKSFPSSYWSSGGYWSTLQTSERPCVPRCCPSVHRTASQLHWAELLARIFYFVTLQHSS